MGPPATESQCVCIASFDWAEQEFGHLSFGLPGDSRLSGPARTDTENTALDVSILEAAPNKLTIGLNP